MSSRRRLTSADHPGIDRIDRSTHPNHPNPALSNPVPSHPPLLVQPIAFGPAPSRSASLAGLARTMPAHARACVRACTMRVRGCVASSLGRTFQSGSNKISRFAPIKLMPHLTAGGMHAHSAAVLRLCVGSGAATSACSSSSRYARAGSQCVRAMRTHPPALLDSRKTKLSLCDRSPSRGQSIRESVI